MASGEQRVRNRSGHCQLGYSAVRMHVTAGSAKWCSRPGTVIPQPTNSSVTVVCTAGSANWRSRPKADARDIRATNPKSPKADAPPYRISVAIDNHKQFCSFSVTYAFSVVLGAKIRFKRCAGSSARSVARGGFPADSAELERGNESCERFRRQRHDASSKRLRLVPLISTQGGHGSTGKDNSNRPGN